MTKIEQALYEIKRRAVRTDLLLDDGKGLEVMPKDSLDEIEARWPRDMADREPHVVTYAAACDDIHSLIAMVRARDGVVEAAREARICLAARGVAARREARTVLMNALAALDTPPDQEPTE